MQSSLVRAVRGTVRLPSTRPQASLEPNRDRIHRINPSWHAARRWVAHGRLPTGRRGRGASAVGARRDALEPASPWNPPPLEPLPLGVPIPVEIEVPLQHATNAEGYVFSVEATCRCTCKLYQPRSVADVRDAIVSAAQHAAREEMVQGAWRYHSSGTGWEKDHYAARVMARIASSPSSSSTMTVQFSSYSVTDVSFDPLATMATAATRLRDPAMAPIFASFAEIARQMTMDGAIPRSMPDKVQAAMEASAIYAQLCATGQPAPPLRNRRWVLSLLSAFLAIGILMSPYVLGFVVLYPDKWSERKDAAIQAYARSFLHSSTWGLFGESLVQRTNRMRAEQQQRRQEEEDKKMEEEAKVRRAEERRKLLEDYEARMRFEAAMTPWQLVRYRFSAGDHRFLQRYRRR